MLRRLFTVASALSLVLCFFAACNSLFVAYIAEHEGGAAYWDELADQWVHQTRGELNRDAVLWGAAAAVFGALSSLWLKRYFKERDKRRCNLRGTCIICGYDLRASKERCPECGTPIP